MDGFSVMTSVFPFLFFIVFGIILIVFVVTFVRGIGEWHKNNNSPRLTVPADERQPWAPSQRKRAYAHHRLHLVLRHF